MTIWEVILGGLVVIGRVMSHFEHKETKKSVTEIKVYINGELEKKLEQAREEGRQEILKTKNKSL